MELKAVEEYDILINNDGNPYYKRMTQNELKIVKQDKEKFDYMVKIGMFRKIKSKDQIKSEIDKKYSK